MAKQFLIPKKRGLIERLRLGSKPRRFEVTDAFIDQWSRRIETRHPLFDISVPELHPAAGTNYCSEGDAQAFPPEDAALRVSRS